MSQQRTMFTMSVAAVSGKRGRRYLRREHLLQTGEAALQFVAMLVHRAPRTWYRDVESCTTCCSSMVPRRWTARSRPPWSSSGA